MKKKKTLMIYNPPVVKVIRVKCERSMVILCSSNMTPEADSWEEDPDATVDTNQDAYLP